ncbi:MAG: FtsX-like permease family protein [Candidatus Moraniibacteriota bacterium]|nr:MAG: FtsX-like permease family protein [Candidatus Moranbacteria bacterium]
MRFLDILKLSLRMFKARTMRTLLTILGMSVGISAIMFLVSFGYGLQRTLLQKITTSDALVSLDVTLGENKDIKLDQATIGQLGQIPDVIDVIPALELAGQGRYDNITLDISTISTGPAYLKSEGLKIEQGRLFDRGDVREIVITKAVAQVFGVAPEDMLGKAMSLTLFTNPDAAGRGTSVDLGTAYTIVGIGEGAENIVYLPLDSLGNITIGQYTKLKVKCRSTDVIEPVRSAISQLGLTASSISETIDQANKVFRAIQFVLMIFGMIALIVSAIGMFNTMTITLLERTEEIGIMKAIGASKSDISLMFVMESTLMGLLGAVGGVGIGYVGGFVINILINAVATRFGGEAVSLFYSPLWFVMTVISFGAFVGFLTGVFPARSASRIDALDALRYK